MARDEYWRWAPEVPAEVWLHYRKVGDGSQLIGAQPYGDESRIHFLVPGEGDRYTKSIMDAAQVVADDMVDGWRRRIDIELHKEPGTYLQLPPGLTEMDDRQLEAVAREYAALEKQRFMRERQEHVTRWSDLYGPVDPFMVMRVAQRYAGRPKADETWWERLHNGAPVEA